MTKKSVLPRSKFRLRQKVGAHFGLDTPNIGTVVEKKIRLNSKNDPVWFYKVSNDLAPVKSSWRIKRKIWISEKNLIRYTEMLQKQNLADN